MAKGPQGRVREKRGKKGEGRKRRIKNEERKYPIVNYTLFFHLLFKGRYEPPGSYNIVCEYHVFHCDGGKCGQPLFLHQAK